jgi:hypothetical protein
VHCEGFSSFMSAGCVLFSCRFLCGVAAGRRKPCFLILSREIFRLSPPPQVRHNLLPPIVDRFAVEASKPSRLDRRLEGWNPNKELLAPKDLAAAKHSVV